MKYSKKQDKKKAENSKKKIGIKIALIIFAILLFIGFLIFLLNLFLLSKFYLGNDVLVNLKASNESFFLTKGTQYFVEFEASVFANPFCKAICNSTFEDLSAGNKIEMGGFSLEIGKPVTKKYPIRVKNFGEGVKLYRYTIECSGIKTTLCRTSEVPSNQKILITVFYNLTPDEKILKENQKKILENYTANLEQLIAKKEEYSYSLEIIVKSLVIDLKDPLAFYQQVSNLNQSLISLKKTWNEKDYQTLSFQLKQFSIFNSETDNASFNLDSSIHGIINKHTLLYLGMETNKNKIQNFQKEIYDEKYASDLQTLIVSFNNSVINFNKKQTFPKKEEIYDNISFLVGNFLNVSFKSQRKHVLETEIKNDILQDIICNITNECISHPAINERANQVFFNLSAACTQTDNILDLLTKINLKLNSTINNSIINNSVINSTLFNSSLLENNSQLNSSSNYLNTSDQVDNNINKSFNISETNNQSFRQLINQISQGIINSYIESISEEAPNYAIISNFLEYTQIQNAQEITPKTLNSPIILTGILTELENLTSKCPVFEYNFSGIEIPKNIEQPYKEFIALGLDMKFIEPLPQCFLFGKYQDCCDEKCSNNSKYYPVIFIHGHAFNKDVSAEYSLEGFNSIQNDLEKNGYLSAGAMTLYSELNPGVWSMPKVPLTIKASYYFDVYGRSDNFVTVQTKSENIDTYSIRLKEIIDKVIARTGKDKVKIVAFSMGCLVIRRYVQIFGTGKVDRIILIGGPNHGISGAIADACPLFGENLECRDMQVDSLFILKLNSSHPPDIPVTNIIGTGCKMDNGYGDGVVLEQSAYLDWANNYIINGTCESAVSPLHLDLINIEKYPQIKKIIEQALN